MSDIFKHFNKFVIVVIVLIVAALAFQVYAATKIVAHIDQYGLKSIVETVWNGNEKSKP